jgi:hypothetical protein
MPTNKESSEAALLPQLEALKTTDISPLIGVAGLLMPRVLDGFLPRLGERQRRSIDRIMPAGGTKKLYLHLVGTPTPPIVVGMAQPPTISTLTEKGVREQGIRGIRLTVEDVQLLLEQRMLRLVWRLKGQVLALLGVLWIFMPLFSLGPRGLKDMTNKLGSHLKPVIDLLPRPRKAIA